jgi:hypothetical protein
VLREVFKVLLRFIMIVFLVTAFAQRHTTITFIAIAAFLLLCVVMCINSNFVGLRPLWHRHDSQAHSAMVS